MKNLEIKIIATRALNYESNYPCDIEVMLKCGEHELILKDEDMKKFDSILLFFEPFDMSVYDRENLINKGWKNGKIEYYEYIKDIKEITLEYIYEDRSSGREYDYVQIYITRDIEKNEDNYLVGCIDYLVYVKNIPHLKEKIKAFNDKMSL